MVNQTHGWYAKSSWDMENKYAVSNIKQNNWLAQDPLINHLHYEYLQAYLPEEYLHIQVTYLDGYNRVLYNGEKRKVEKWSRKGQVKTSIFTNSYCWRKKLGLITHYLTRQNSREPSHQWEYPQFPKVAILNPEKIISCRLQET